MVSYQYRGVVPALTKLVPNRPVIRNPHAIGMFGSEYLTRTPERPYRAQSSQELTDQATIVAWRLA